MSDKSVPFWIFKIPTPKTQVAKFEEIFKQADQNTKEIFKRISSVRDELKRANDIETSYYASIQAAENYLPHLFGLMLSSETLPPEFSKWLQLLWTTPLTIRYSLSPFVYSSLHWEIVMVLFTYAISLRNLASDTMAAVTDLSEFDEKSKTATNLLTKAAGILTHIHERELAQWKIKPDTYLAEAKDEIYLVLSTICLCETQELTIKKGIMKGTSTALLSKLCMDVSQKYEYCASMLKEKSSEILPPLINYIEFNIALWKAEAYRLVGSENSSQGHYGSAVAYLQLAVDSFIDRKDPTLELFLVQYNTEKKQIQFLLEKYRKENDDIYYEKVPKGNELPPIEAKSLPTKATPYAPPAPYKITIMTSKDTGCTIQ